MVEVDVFWSYAIGSGFALSAFRQLRKLHAESGGDTELSLKDALSPRNLVREIEDGDNPVFHNPYFLRALLFLSLLFVPSGANLLWSNPNWETMQVGRFETIPGWLVSGFTITNVTQGILGYRVTYHYLMKGRYFSAAKQAVIAYLCFWFILVNGWDKTGYQRFFSRNREAFEDWKWSNVFGWLTSDVVRILLAYGAVFIPLMLYWMSKWVEEGYAEEHGIEQPADIADMRSRMAKTSGSFLATVFGAALGGAVTAHLLIRRFGWVRGLLAFCPVLYLGFLSNRSLGPALLRRILHLEPGDAPPVWEMAE